MTRVAKRFCVAFVNGRATGRPKPARPTFRCECTCERAALAYTSSASRNG